MHSAILDIHIYRQICVTSKPKIINRINLYVIAKANSNFSLVDSRDLLENRRTVTSQ